MASSAATAASSKSASATRNTVHPPAGATWTVATPPGFSSSAAISRRSFSSAAAAAARTPLVSAASSSSRVNQTSDALSFRPAVRKKIPWRTRRPSRPVQPPRSRALGMPGTSSRRGARASVEKVPDALRPSPDTVQR